MKAADGRFFDGAIHLFHLPVGPWMEGAYQAMLDAMPMADHIKPMRFVGFRPWALGKLRARCAPGTAAVAASLQGTQPPAPV